MSAAPTFDLSAGHRRAHQEHARTQIRAEAPEPKVADGVAVLRLYDVIDSWGGPFGVAAREFVTVLDELPDETTEIRLMINSPGGEVWEGLAILNALRGHEAKVVAVVEGMAASSASFIACGVDELEMAPNSELFVHNAWGLCVGNAADMRKMAEDLDHEDRNIASIYATKAGGDIDQWLAAMADETYLSAEEAVAAGLADRIGSAPTADEAKNRWDRSIFATRSSPAATHLSATPPSPSPTAGQKGGSMPELTPELLALLGLTETATADDLQSTLTELVDKATAPPPAPAAAKLPDGVVAIDTARLAQLEADAAAGREAHNRQVKADRERLVDAAIADGRIPPVRRDAWLAQLAADPGAEQVLAGLAKGTIPIDQIGTNGAGDLDSALAEDIKMFGEAEARRMHGQEVTA